MYLFLMGGWRAVGPRPEGLGVIGFDSQASKRGFSHRVCLRHSLLLRASSLALVSFALRAQLKQMNT